MLMSTLSLHCSGMDIMNEFQIHPDIESWWGLLPAKPKERVREEGAAPVGHFLCARHYSGSVGVRSRSHLSSTRIHTVDRVVVITVSQLAKLRLSKRSWPSKCQGLCDVKAVSYLDHVSSS